LAEEMDALFGRAEAKDMFDHGAVVPASINEGDWARGRKMIDIALELPRRRFGYRGL
jgi:hypothetical protein